MTAEKRWLKPRSSPARGSFLFFFPFFLTQTIYLLSSTNSDYTITLSSLLLVVATLSHYYHTLPNTKRLIDCLTPLCEIVSSTSPGNPARTNLSTLPGFKILLFFCPLEIQFSQSSTGKPGLLFLLLLKVKEKKTPFSSSRTLDFFQAKKLIPGYYQVVPITFSRVPFHFLILISCAICGPVSFTVLYTSYPPTGLRKSVKFLPWRLLGFSVRLGLPWMDQRLYAP
jgi:hypothetical protein